MTRSRPCSTNSLNGSATCGEEANAKGLRRLEEVAAKREDTYKDHGIGIGDLVLRRSPEATKLHPRWDGSFVVHDLTDRNTYQLRTKNGYVLRTLYTQNGSSPTRARAQPLVLQCRPPAARHQGPC